MEKNKKLKKLEELKFDTVGDEYIYLYESISDSDYVHILQDKSNTPDIQLLRDTYKEIVKNNNLDKKYEGHKRYWFAEHEKAVADYIYSNDEIERNRIFSTILYKPITKLIENIIFTYKLFRDDMSIQELQADCMSFLIQQFTKFNPKTGAQAFSYFGTIAKHHMMNEKKNSYKRSQSNLDITENIDEASNKPENIYNLEIEKVSDINTEMFEGIILKLQDDINKEKIMPNDKKVYEAIVYIFNNHGILATYNKNKLYLLMKERTGLHTKDITYSLSRLKKEYDVFKKAFLKTKL